MQKDFLSIKNKDICLLPLIYHFESRCRRIAVATAFMAYNHPKSMNQNSIPQYRITCQNHVKVKIAMRTKVHPIQKPSLEYGRDFRNAISVAPQANNARFINIRVLESIEI